MLTSQKSAICLAPSLLLLAFFSTALALFTGNATTPSPPTSAPLSGRPCPRRIVRARALSLIAKNELAARIGLSRLIKSQCQMLQGAGCPVNLCFALDGSKTITPAQYAEQQQLSQVVAFIAALDPLARFSAVQYGLSNVGISSATGDLESFMTAVNVSKQIGRPEKFLGGGLAFCVSAVREMGKEGRVVFMGDGISNLPDGYSTIVLPGLMKEEQVFAVGVGDDIDKAKLLEVAGKDKKKLFLAPGKLQTVVNLLVSRVCFTPTRKMTKPE